jgi:hypothetical protein
VLEVMDSEEGGRVITRQRQRAKVHGRR